MSSTAVNFAPVAAPTGEPIRLAMQRLWLAGHILPAGARLSVQHVFRSAETKPLEVIYSFVLPRDAALRAFRITGDGFEAHSELKQTEDAVKAYEQGVAAGSLSTLARQYGDGVVNLTVGNIRPGETVTVHLDVLSGVELRDDGFRFRFPFTLAPGYHSQMRAARVSDEEAELELPANLFGDMILPNFREDASSLHEVGFDLMVHHELALEELGSPSHSVRIKNGGAAPSRMWLAAERDIPNRDLVLDVRFKQPAAQALAGPNSDGKRSFAVIVPSTAFGANSGAPRRTVIVLDRSGSMQGAPIAQARKAIEACLAALDEKDSFGLVAFDNRAESMHGSLLDGTRENRDRARAFLSNVDARGGTELAQAIVEASKILNGAGDILILTDGQVMGTEQILAQARGSNIRLHCLGIGSASQDRFLTLLSRETGGLSRFITARERVDLAAVDLFASIGRPIASGLKARPDIAPEPPAAVFAGTPILLFGETSTTGDALELTWDGGGSLRVPIPDGDPETGQTIRLLQGSRLITDWESRYPSEEALAPLEKRKQSRVAARLTELSNTYGLASREMSLVAVVKRAGDKPGDLPETRVVPVGMPQDVNFGAYFGASVTGAFAAMQPAMAMPPPPQPAAPTPMARAASPLQGLLGRMRMARSMPAPELTQARYVPPPPPPPEPETATDILMDLASQLETDGGMPGNNVAERAMRTVALVLAFVADRHTLQSGAFRSHVAKLVAFLKSVQGLSQPETALVHQAINAASTGKAPRGDWLALARRRGLSYANLEAVI